MYDTFVSAEEVIELPSFSPALSCFCSHGRGCYMFILGLLIE